MKSRQLLRKFITGVNEEEVTNSENYARAKEVLNNHRNILDNMVKVLFEKETIYTEDVEGLFEGKTAEEVIENINLREKSKEKYKKDKEQNNAINTKINIVEEKNIDANSETSKKDLEKEATIDIIEPIETKELNQNPNETKVDNEEKKD